MQLLDYLRSMTPEAREDFARRCGTSPDYLLQIGYGNRRPKIALAVSIERESACQIRCEQLLPEVDWIYLRQSAQQQAAVEERAT